MSRLVFTRRKHGAEWARIEKGTVRSMARRWMDFASWSILARYGSKTSFPSKTLGERLSATYAVRVKLKRAFLSLSVPGRYKVNVTHSLRLCEPPPAQKPPPAPETLPF
jgi:hypothetical protein